MGFLWFACVVWLVLLSAPTSFSSKPGFFSRVISLARKQSVLEQTVEDINTQHDIDQYVVRRLIVMPLNEIFCPSRDKANLYKLQDGDKCSLPFPVGQILSRNSFEAPWLFEIMKVNESYLDMPRDIDQIRRKCKDMCQLHYGLNKRVAYFSPLDFRSPSNYIFVPKWMMEYLDLQPNSVVDVKFIRLSLAGLVILQPRSIEWDRLLKSNSNAKQLLEHEINNYSSLTTGSTIKIHIDDKEFSFFVKECRGENGVPLKGVRIQDSDLRVDIDHSYLDSLTQNK